MSAKPGGSKPGSGKPGSGADNTEKGQRGIRLFPTPWYFNLVVALLVGALLGGLAFSSPLRIGDHRLFDALLRLRPAVPQDERIVLLNIDDRAVRMQGQWPWRRSVMADGVWLMSEFAPRSIVLDFDYSDPSPPTINRDAQESGGSDQLRQRLGQIEQNLSRLRQAAEGGSMPAQAMAPLLGDLARQAQAARDQVSGEIGGLIVDNDRALGRAVGAGEDVKLAFVMTDSEPDVSIELRSAAREAFRLEVSREGGTIPQWQGVRPMIQPLLEAADGAGFINNEVDRDGVTRSAQLYATTGEAVYGHLVAPLFHEVVGVQSIEAQPGRYVLQTEERGRIRIPQRADGSVLINWPKARYLESFRHLSYARILNAQQLEEDLRFNLAQMRDAGYFSYGTSDTSPLALLELADETRREMEQSGNSERMSEYRELRRAAFALVGRFLSGPARSRMLDEIERQRQGGELSQQQAEQMDALEEDVNNVFSRTREIYNALREQRQHLEQELADSFVFTGFTATATTDIGVTPFDERYVNLGVHAAVLNTLLSGAFLSEAPRWAAVPVAVLVPLLIAVAIRGRRPAAHAGLGSAVIALLVAATAILFAVTGIYVPVLAGLIASVVTLGILTVIALIETERDKRWLHNAFEHYISAEFIDELVHNPSKLDLGGQEQELTAMFTDIRQFTSIAENLPAGDLVSLLNRYLTQMSDLVLDEYGTIDKYEGDAIIAFFGAPIAVPDHPRRACEAALRMKRAEQELNTAIIRDGYSKLPLQTRIGINTGTMLVGNLGTTRRMDYTIMGHQANVASRLEGANKLYGTWILVGEQTYAQVGDGFVFRPLDRVRLSGVQSPIRLYQLITMAGEETPVLKEALEIFADGLAAYERGEFLYAEERFDIVRRYYPDDGPAMLFSERCSLYRENEEVGPDWDGITTLQSK